MINATAILLSLALGEYSPEASKCLNERLKQNQKVSQDIEHVVVRSYLECERIYGDDLGNDKPEPIG